MADTDLKGALAKRDDAILGAAVSAAVGVAVYGLRKALSEGGGELSLRQHSDDRRGENGRSGSALATVWESASDALLPLAEDAAAAAGRWAAKSSPALFRDRLLPRFVDSFKAAA